MTGGRGKKPTTTTTATTITAFDYRDMYESRDRFNLVDVGSAWKDDQFRIRVD